MKKIFLTALLFATPLLAMDFNYTKSDDTLIARCFGLNYMAQTCVSWPHSCDICSLSDSVSQCDVKVAATSLNELSASLPRATRLESGVQRGICNGSESDAQCGQKITTYYGAVALGRPNPRCTVKDAQNVTLDEWLNCEDKGSKSGVNPSISMDELPAWSSCRKFLYFVVEAPLDEAMVLGRRHISNQSAEEVDLDP